MSDSEDNDIAKGNRHVQDVEFHDERDDSWLNFDENNSDRDQIGVKVMKVQLLSLDLDLDLVLSRVCSVGGGCGPTANRNTDTTKHYELDYLFESD
ncbi:splicing factor, arginine/serine-rich 7 [Plakobranchus ocellatus]|uniref:Splicing factor, arginine/serine-rich 7 n=1 Tax=Plakobranchus ocellatus TaxID=259542 RepID=A0AAV4DHM1_9GAST|nr:splicing factor, arginine/serine-rich 7 [Plakobranchus ocellatus]